MGYLIWLQLILIILKIVGLVTWGWVWVLFPLLAVLLMYILAVFILAITSLID